MKDTIYDKLKDRDWLYEQYVTKVRTAKSIADEVGCHWSSVARALSRLKIPKRKRTSKYLLLNNKEWLREMYVDRKLSTREIGKMIGATGGVIYSALAPAGITPRTNEESLQGKYPEGRWGEDASNWQGGRRIAGGYIYIYMPDHPAARGGVVQEHRLVMEQHLGRYLKADEIIHHLDGNKMNNAIENLELTNRAEHSHNHFGNVTNLRKQVTKQGKRVAELEQENEKLKEEIKKLREH